MHVIAKSNRLQWLSESPVHQQQFLHMGLTCEMGMNVWLRWPKCAGDGVLEAERGEWGADGCWMGVKHGLLGVPDREPPPSEISMLAASASSMSNFDGSICGRESAANKTNRKDTCKIYFSELRMIMSEVLSLVFLTCHIPSIL